MNRFSRKILLLVALLIVITLIACNKDTKTIDDNSNTEKTEQSVVKEIEENNKKDEAFLKKQVEERFRDLIKVSFGKMVEEIDVNNIVLYTGDNIPENVQALRLNDNEVAFKINYSIKSAENVDKSVFENMTGKYEDGWVKDNENYGVLRPSGDSDYKITNYGSEL